MGLGGGVGATWFETVMLKKLGDFMQREQAIFGTMPDFHRILRDL